MSNIDLLSPLLASIARLHKSRLHYPDTAGCIRAVSRPATDTVRMAA
jgi:hypothetical protein